MKKFLVGIFLSVFFFVSGYTCDIEDQLETVATTDPVLYQQTDVDVTPAVEETVVTTGEGEAKQEPAGLGATAGIQMIISENLKVYIIPLTYVLPLSSLAGTLKIEAGIPFVSRRVVDWYNVEHKKSGLGDISVKATYDYGDEVYFRGIYGLIVKAPTGDENYAVVVDALGLTYPIPFGTGTWDIGAFITAIRKISRFRVFGNLGYRLNGNYENETTGTKTKNAGILTFLIGSEYKFNPFWFPFLKLRILNKGESKTDNGWGYVGNTDDMLAVDLILGTRYMVLSFIGVSFGIEIPVSTKYNSALTTKPKRKAVFNIKGSYRF